MGRGYQCKVYWGHVGVPGLPCFFVFVGIYLFVTKIKQAIGGLNGGKYEKIKYEIRKLFWYTEHGT